MFTLGYSKSYRSLFQQQLANILWGFKPAGVNTAVLQPHVNDMSIHEVKTSSQTVVTSILNHQISYGLSSDWVTDGLWMSDFNPQPTTIDKLNLGLLEGAAHLFFTGSRTMVMMMENSLNYINYKPGKRVLVRPGATTINVTLSGYTEELRDGDYIRFHSPALFNNSDEVLDQIDPSTIVGFTEISPNYLTANPFFINTTFNFSWILSSYNTTAYRYKLSADSLPSDWFYTDANIIEDPTVSEMMAHVEDNNIHYMKTWNTPVLKDNQVISGSVITTLGSATAINTRPPTGDWFITPSGESMSYQAELTSGVGHWMAMSIGDPNALVTDPDDPSIVLGECVNGTDEMRTYFTLPYDKLPVATPGVILRRCNPGLGFIAKTLNDYGGP